jgi:hypothetical protein
VRTGDPPPTVIDCHVDAYVTDLVAACPLIESVWLLSSRVNDTARPDSDWDLLVFADDAAFRR